MKLKKELMLKFMMMLFVAVLAGGAMTSCSNDDDVSKKDLVGKWLCDDNESWVLFNSNKTGLVGIEDDEDEIEYFNWKLKGNLLTINIGGEIETAEVTMTENTLTLRFIYDDGEEYDTMTYYKVDKFPWE